MTRSRKRTTITFDESVHEQAKSLAAKRGETLGEFVQDAVLREIRRAKQPRAAISLPTVPGGKLRPGVDINSNAKLLELLDEGVPLGQLR